MPLSSSYRWLSPCGVVLLLTLCARLPSEVLWSADAGVRFHIRTVEQRSTAFEKLPLDGVMAAFNGAYFNRDFIVDGYFRKAGVLVNETANPALSAYVCIDAAGQLHARTALPDRPEDYRDIFQAGPFVVDPGGTAGIRTDTGQVANRLMLAKGKDAGISFLYFKRSTLHEAMDWALLHEFDWVVNLDGGPTLFYWIAGGERFFNRAPKMLICARDGASGSDADLPAQER